MGFDIESKRMYMTIKEITDLLDLAHMQVFSSVGGTAKQMYKLNELVLQSHKLTQYLRQIEKEDRIANKKQEENGPVSVLDKQPGK